jgi:hypothetical protein
MLLSNFTVEHSGARIVRDSSLPHSIPMHDKGMMAQIDISALNIQQAIGRL